METGVLEPTKPLLDPLVASVSTEALPGVGGHERSETIISRPKKEIQARLCEMDNDDIKCGLGPCKPDCVQVIISGSAYLDAFLYKGNETLWKLL